MESKLDKLTREILEVVNGSPKIVINTENGPEKDIIKKLVLSYFEFLSELNVI